ncbi:MAG TPA: hypothetical protein VF898_10705 [Chloroflexota bacterium]
MPADEPDRPLNRSDLADELQAAVRAREELSRDEERFLIETFLQRLDVEIDARIQARISSRSERKSVNPAAILPVVLVFAIPLSAIAAGTAGLTGLIVAWISIVIVTFVASHGWNDR